jgi:hypothetical protein
MQYMNLFVKMKMVQYSVTWMIVLGPFIVTMAHKLVKHN